ncbi:MULTISPECIES: hypothetical protein [Marivita]|uniref:DUF4325 domain-containing protein n=1 Tax=Marivita cryptomonadis TaxID=505252 RepID=A0A9Q2PBX5_9RHOB|nr:MULTISPECIES: hypothetical protein [Marivita]MCR9170563.1 hypothetical protein [Paracoccaceae bacterium]MBM2322034.1 hypothetical protein [Marivita cryptomonadis]MBM2331615.1 hypothetical protein [Marivita cryptomonadis]MBM2341200.1 hypothetical protein [Marivita cryptomonadis]MBM2345863.1 hypothetical protein [Marivita cryptomonadis]
MTQIDLSRLTRNEVTMLTGHPRGLSARELFDLDSLDSFDEPVDIVAPTNLDTITPSFVQGFLAGSLSHMGVEKLRLKYRLSKLPDVLREDFETGIQRLLLHRQGLEKAN